jgi:hypothetical protein
MNYYPVILFTYKKIETLKKTLNGLLSNRECILTDLIIYSDGPASIKDHTEVQIVRDYLSTVSGFKSCNVIHRNRNYGLAQNIFTGVSEVLRSSNAAIVLEDDIVVNEYFLSFMNKGLSFYENDLKVSSVSGISYFEEYDQQHLLPETFFIRGADCLAWGTWTDRWEGFELEPSALMAMIRMTGQQKDFDRGGCYPFFRMLRSVANKKLSSWAVCWYAYNFLKQKYILFPRKSFAQHIGTLAESENYHSAGSVDPLLVPLTGVDVSFSQKPICELPVTAAMYNGFLKRSRGSFLFRLKYKFRKFLKIARRQFLFCN